MNTTTRYEILFWLSPENPTLVKKQYHPTVQTEDRDWEDRLPQANFLNTNQSIDCITTTERYITGNC